MRLNCCESGARVAGRVILAVALLLAGAVVLNHVSGQPLANVSSNFHAPIFGLNSSATLQPTSVAYGQLPLIFEANQGQTDPQVKFVAQGSGYGLFLTADEAVLALQSSAADHSRQVSALRMSLVGGRSGVEVTGTDLLPGKSHYLIGNDPTRWHRNISQFARVRYHEVYPGIDLVYYGKQGKLEYDFEVSPGADPKQVALRLQGAGRTSLAENGDLVLTIRGSELHLQAPRVYQTVADEQKPVDGHFVLLADNKVGFEIGEYDRSRALVIDPVLSYSTYLGGSGDETFPTIAVDASSNIYVAGTTTSADFPIPAGSTPLQTAPATGATASVFIAKLDPSGSTLLFSTYLGGDGTSASSGIAVDTGFNVAVVGTTSSTNFPTKNAFKNAPVPAGNHVFVSEVDAAGANLLYSTYLAGTGTDTATGVALDIRNKIYVTGTTNSPDFPATAGAFQTTPAAANQFFMSKVDPATSAVASLPYSTYFGGGNPAGGTVIGGGIAVDRNSNVYITGGTNFLHTGTNPATDFPILNATQACLDGPSNPSPCPTGVTATDAFVAKFDPAAPVGSQLIYSTYIGGTANDVGSGIAVDTGGAAYLTGTTNSGDIAIPASTTPFQKCLDDTTNPATCTAGATATDAFLAKLSNFTTATTSVPTVTVLYFSYLGGSGNDSGLAVAVDAFQGARITGSTASSDFHTTLNPVQAAPGGGTSDAFVARIDTTATSATAPGHYSTYLGGSGPDRGTGIAVDSSGAAYVAGETTSGNFPRVTPFQNTLGGGSDAFVSKLAGVVNLSMSAVATPKIVGIGNQVTYTFTIKNNGDLATGIIFRDNLPANGTFVSATASAGSCGTPGGIPVVLTCNLGALNSSATTTVAVILVPTAPGSLGNSAVLLPPASGSASDSANVNDYTLGLTPNSQTVAAGRAVTYTATVTPTGSIPNAVSINCSGLPNESSCSLANGSISNLTNGSPQTRSLVVNTTERVTTTAQLKNNGPFYALWLPVSGLAFLGLGIRGTMSRRRRTLLALLVGGFLALTLLQAGCGSSQQTTTTTTGTPAGTYTFTVTATSGSASHSQTAQLIVQ